EVVRGALAGPLPVTMDGLSMEVDLLEGQKTGFFLDQRENRLALARFVNQRSLLDVFCHQGAWGLYALKAGAAHVVGVDPSEPPLELARLSAASNGFADRFTTRAGDAFDILRSMA